MRKRVFSILLFYILLIVVNINLYALTHGNSAWVYDKNQRWVDQITAFNQRATPTCRLNYLFPEAAIVHVDNAKHRLIYQYDSSVTLFYKSRLPNVNILPDFSFWVAGSNFMRWNKSDYQLAAEDIAKKINQDPNADGVFLDLENFKPVLLPFYETLASRLRENHKVFSVIIRPGQENVTWFKTLGQNSFVVLYGYDLHSPGDNQYPVSPAYYKQRLLKAFNGLIQVANITHTPVMAGIPVVATTYEWERKKISSSGSNDWLDSQYRQIDYLKAALSVYANVSSDLYRGYSIWAFVDDSHKDRINELPYQISSESWKLLQACAP